MCTSLVALLYHLGFGLFVFWGGVLKYLLDRLMIFLNVFYIIAPQFFPVCVKHVVPVSVKPLRPKHFIYSDRSSWPSLL